jgi:phosphoribosylglycinamide formyltransferase-1
VFIPGVVAVPVATSHPGRVVVLASGTGSVFDAFARAVTVEGEIEITGLVCDQPDAGVVERADEVGVPAHVVPLLDRGRRAEWDGELAEVIAAAEPDLVVSAGFMRLLGPAVLDRFRDRVINTHPALLPSFPGAHAVRDALDYGVRVTGCTVHLVDSGVDTGPVIAQRVVEVLADDDEGTLHERIKEVERRLLPEVVLGMLRHGWTINGRRVTIP